jgi:hypothetical protein
MKHRPTSRRRRSSSRSVLHGGARRNPDRPARCRTSATLKSFINHKAREIKKSSLVKHSQLYRMYRKTQLKLKNEVAVSSLEVSWIHRRASSPLR